MNKNKYIPILDPGHGGLIDGKYVTPGKRSPNWEMGVLYEGVYNRDIADRIALILEDKGIPFFYPLQGNNKDVKLSYRVDEANDIRRDFPNAYFLSLHGNAGGGTGFEGFTYVGQSESDIIAEMFLQDLMSAFPEKRMRSDKRDGDLDKESKFYVLKHTNCSAVLLELLFMDNKEDYKSMWSDEFRDRVSQVIAGTIEKIYNNGV